MFFSKLVIRVYLMYRSPCSIGSKDPSQASMTQSNTNLDFEVLKIELELGLMFWNWNQNQDL